MIMDDNSIPERGVVATTNDKRNVSCKTTTTSATEVLSKDFSKSDLEQQQIVLSSKQFSPNDDDDKGPEEVRPPYLEFIGEKTKGLGWIVCSLVVVGYSLAAFILDFRRALLLFVVEVWVVGLLLFHYVTDRFCPQYKAKTQDRIIDWFVEDLEESKLAGGVLLAAMVAIVGSVTRDPKNLISALGLVVFAGLSWLTSYKPKDVRWRPVISGIFLQFLLGVLILRVEPIAQAFGWLGDKVAVFLKYSDAGAMFVYGFLADQSMSSTVLETADGEGVTLFPPFYFTVLSVVFFFSAVVSILTYLEVIGYLVKKVGLGLAVLMGTSGPETFNCVANMFLSMTESPLLIRPLLSEVSESELHAIMTAGFASVAGSVLAAYISFGASPSDLLAASIMSAPAALAISKLIYPETTIRRDRASLFDLEMAKSTDPNIVAAASSGASLAVDMVLQIGGQLIAIVALVAMVDGFLQGIGNLIDLPLSFNIICSYIFYPLAWLMGVSSDDCLDVASLIGTKIIVNEFAAYAQLGVLIREGHLSERSITIATYALCGFSNIGSIGVSVAVLSSLTKPSMKPIITRLVTSAMIAGNTACFMTACVAGLFYSPTDGANNQDDFDPLVDRGGNSTEV